MAARMLPPTWSDARSDRGPEVRVYHALAWINRLAVGLGLVVQMDFVLCHPQYGVIVLGVKGGAEIICGDHQAMGQ